MDYFEITQALKDYDEGSKMELVGICRNAIFKAEETDYAVYHFETNDGKLLKIQGSFPSELIDGQTYKLKGKVIIYRGEKQLRVFEYIVSKPINRKGIISYLQTLYGLKKKAEDIYEIFGDDSINVLLNDPMKVAKSVRGIGKKSVEKWQEKLKELEDNQEVYIKLFGLGLNAKTANKLISKYGPSVVDVINENPYILMKEVKGYGFLKCDKLGLNNGILPDNPFRIRSSVAFILEEGATKGHCYLPLEELVISIMDKLNLKLTYKEMVDIYSQNSDVESIIINKYEREYTIDIEHLKECIDEYATASIENRDKCRYVYHDISPSDIGNQINYLITSKAIIYENKRVYLKRLFFAEVNFSKNIKRLAVYKPKYKREVIENILDDICKETGFELETKQRIACIECNLFEGGVYVLDGSAGTGKTFTLNLILEVSKRLSSLDNEGILAVAPTGKASKVASKAIGIECKTIHRALGFNYMEGGFCKCAEDPFEEDMNVCDESSMLDIELANAYVNAIHTGSKLILMGDIKQLSSVGAGNVLKDLIESDCIKVITLDVIKRQGLLSGIVKNANRLIDSKMIKSEPSTKDFFVLERTGIDSVKSCVIESIKRLLSYPEYSLEEIQVLIPQRTGSLGVNMFNLLIQSIFNPYDGGLRILKTKFEAKPNQNSSSREFELYIQKGDKVMHIKNNYSMNLYKKDLTGKFIKDNEKMGITNGEAGIVEDIYKIGKSGIRVVVKYEDYYVYYDEGVEELELSYATTIHKSQGSAWKAIILPIVAQHTHMLSNNLIYTGITRARDFCAVVGDKKTIFNGINTFKDYTRYTSLKERLVS